MICILFFQLPLDGELSKEAMAIETLAMEAIKQVTPGPAQENLHALTKLLPKRRGKPLALNASLYKTFTY